jgi:hypothetical protein
MSEAVRAEINALVAEGFISKAEAASLVARITEGTE